MNILVVNAGSSSLKYQLINMKDESVTAKGICERIGQRGSLLKAKGKNGEIIIEKPMPTHVEAIKLVLDALVNKEYGVISSMKDINAVGHRVVHSAEDFSQSVIIDDDVLRICENNADLAPLHVPPNIMGITACREVMPNVPMVAVFDTTFHSTIPQYAYMYALPYEDYTKLRIRRYGFHGTSHKFVSEEMNKILNKKDSKIITCHLGNGASIAAVRDGKCLDTSMGFTPLEGLIMGTRSGDIDPAIIEYLCAKKNMNAQEAISYLNKKSGVDGISGIGSDFRDLTKAAAEGNKLANLAIDMFCYRVKKYIGSYAAVMDGVDAIVFTAGIGENTGEVRERILNGLNYLGVSYDNQRNYNCERGKPVDLTATGSKVKIYIIPTNEELVIARETMALVK